MGVDADNMHVLSTKPDSLTPVPVPLLFRPLSHGIWLCRVGGGWAWQPSHRPLAHTARAGFPHAAFLRGSTLESSWDKTGDQRHPSPQADLLEPPPRGRLAPPRVPPAVGQARLEAACHPPIPP